MLTCHSTLAFYQHIIWHQLGWKTRAREALGREDESSDGRTNGVYQHLTQTRREMRCLEFKTLSHSTLQQQTIALVMCQCYRSPPNNQLCLAAVPTMHYEPEIVIYSTAECVACNEKNMQLFSHTDEKQVFNQSRSVRFPLCPAIIHACLLILSMNSYLRLSSECLAQKCDVV